ncbi:MAG TPA: carbohydrate kinase [Mariniphaga anaerophila]|uniref:Carbohydrate kinase n=1 Tax=Mariniphaga anaerophila TaxID=1484053 RepID=A0A831LPV8_9BACT|nr:carbohydrate kinase [Mariniphaga anaerophila]
MDYTGLQTVVCFGEVLWDMLPGGARPGGAPLNVGIHLKRQGIHPLLVSRIGNDREGEKLRRFLLKSKMDLRFLQTDNALPTSQVLVHLDEHKNATYEICEPVAWDNIQFSKKMDNLAAKADLIVFGTLASRNETTRKTLLKFLEHSPAKRFLDVNLRPPYDTRDVVEKMLHLADFVKLNNDELQTIARWNSRNGNEEELSRWFFEYFSCSTVCVTRGANGAAILKDDKWFEHPGFKVVAVDTVGSGDSFLAGLIAQLSAGSSPEKALEYACATGAFVASRQGAVPEYSARDIEAFIK